MIKTKKLLLALGLCNLIAIPAFAQGTAFTYQGRLNSGTNLASGSYDLQFTLFTNSSGGTSVAGPVVNTATAVSNGLFTVTVDFGSTFTGSSNWLELAVRTNGASSFSPALTPRQQVTPVPYAITSANLSGPLPAGSIGSAQLAPNIGVWNQAGSTLSYGGNVGIGVANPSDALDVAIGGVIGNNTTSVTEHDVSNQGTKVSFGYKDLASQDFNGMAAVVDPGMQGCGNSGDVLFYTWQCNTATSREVMRVNGFGDVGIGTTNPAARVDIAGTGFSDDAKLLVETAGGTLGPQLRLKRGGADGDEWVLVTDGLANGPLNALQIVQTSAGARMVFATNGNVGIGTSAPATALDVNGTVSAATFSGSGSSLTGVALLGTGNTFSTDQTVLGQLQVGGSLAAVTMLDRFHPVNGFGWQWVSDTTGLNAKRFDGGAENELFTISTNGNVGIGMNTPKSDALLQVNGKVRMGSETGTSEAPTRSILVRRINTTSSAVGQVVARVSSIFTLERDGTPGGFIIKITASAGAPVIAATGITSSGATVNYYNALFGGGAGTYQIFTEAQQIGHFSISFGDPLNPGGDMTEVVLTRFFGNANDTANWVGTVTSTFNQ